MGVVLPDNFGSYEYYYKYNPESNSTTHFTNQLFDILKQNMFNIKNPNLRTCNGTIIHEGESSYIKTIEWDNFINNINNYIEIAVDIWRNRENYKLKKTV